jgi:hypothetical protein
MDLCNASPRPKSFGSAASAGFVSDPDFFSETVGFRISVVGGTAAFGISAACGGSAGCGGSETFGITSGGKAGIAVTAGGTGGTGSTGVPAGEVGLGTGLRLPPGDSSESGGSGGLVLLTSGRRFASNIASTSAHGVAYLAREAAMIAAVRSLPPSDGSGFRNARLKSQSFRSTRTIAWNFSSRVRLLASKDSKPSPNFLASSSHDPRAGLGHYRAGHLGIALQLVQLLMGQREANPVFARAGQNLRHARRNEMLKLVDV